MGLYNPGGRGVISGILWYALLEKYESQIEMYTFPGLLIFASPKLWNALRIDIRTTNTVESFKGKDLLVYRSLC